MNNDFIVTIDRSTFERGYVLKKIDRMGRLVAQNEPLKRDEFIAHFGFDPIWPHKQIKNSTQI